MNFFTCLTESNFLPCYGKGNQTPMLDEHGALVFAFFSLREIKNFDLPYGK